MGLFQWLWRGRENSTTAQSQHKLVKIGDRSYVEGTSYVLPKDEREMSRLDFQHYLLHYMLQENYIAPLTKPGRMLDIGCGTGLWAIEMAAAFPKTEIVALDIVKPVIDPAKRPRNVLFLQRDVLKGLPFTDGIFDYVHLRFLIGSLPVDKYIDVVKELFRVVKPNGWIELSEPGNLNHASPALKILWIWLFEFAHRRGLDMSASSQIGSFLQSAGFVNITTRVVEIPIGAHGEQAGRMAAKNVLEVAEAIRAPIIALNITSAENYDRTIQRVKDECAQLQGKSSGLAHIAIAQRPI